MRIGRGLVWLLPLVGSCLEPTEVKLQLSTDIADVAPVTILVDGRPIGGLDHLRSGENRSLVFVPSKKMGARFTIQIEGLAAMQKVRASRSVSYVEHQTLLLPVELQASCLGVVCDPGQSCTNGQCVGDSVDCMSKTCVQDAGPDVVLPPIDSGADVVQPKDPCKGAYALAMGGQVHHWSFDEATGDAIDSIGMVKVPLISGYTRTTMKYACGQALVLGTAQMQAQTMYTSMPGQPAMAFQLYVPSGTTTPLVLVQASNGTVGWQLKIDGKPMTLTLAFGGQIIGDYAYSTLGMMNDQWYHVEVYANGSMVSFAVDSMTEAVKTMNGLSPGAGLPLEIGPDTKTMIDELGIYDGKPGN